MRYERQPDPTPEEIRKACEAIRSKNLEAKRKSKSFPPKQEYMPRVCSTEAVNLEPDDEDWYLTGRSIAKE